MDDEPTAIPDVRRTPLDKLSANRAIPGLLARVLGRETVPVAAFNSRL